MYGVVSHIELFDSHYTLCYILFFLGVHFLISILITEININGKGSALMKSTISCCPHLSVASIDVTVCTSNQISRKRGK